MNPELIKRIDGVFSSLQQLMNHPFPSEAAEPNDDFSNEGWQRFYADSPHRLIQVISWAYFDCITDEEDENEKPCDELFDDYDGRYRNIYMQCVENITAAWGEGKIVLGNDMMAYGCRNSVNSWYLPSSPDIFETVPTILLNPAMTLHSLWKTELTYWVKGDRIGFVHYIGDKGDDDFYFAVSIGVMSEQEPEDGLLFDED